MKQGDGFDFNPTWKVKLTVLRYVENDKGGLLELEIQADGKAQFDYSIRQIRNTIIYSSMHGTLDIYLDNNWKSIPEKSSFTINQGVTYRLRNHADSPLTFNMKIEPMYHFTQIIKYLFAFVNAPYYKINRKQNIKEKLVECYQSDFEFNN